MKNFIEFLARLMIAQIFLIAGFQKVVVFAESKDLMEAHNVPPDLLWAVVVLEIAAAIMLILGFWVRWVALALAAFCIATAVIFHANFDDPAQVFMFLKNVAMAGGLLLIVVHKACGWSIDARREGSINKVD